MPAASPIVIAILFFPVISTSSEFIRSDEPAQNAVGVLQESEKFELRRNRRENTGYHKYIHERDKCIGEKSARFVKIALFLQDRMNCQDDVERERETDKKYGVIIEFLFYDKTLKEYDYRIERKKIGRKGDEEIGAADFYIPALPGNVKLRDLAAENKSPNRVSEFVGHYVHKDRTVKQYMKEQISDHTGKKKNLCALGSLQQHKRVYESPGQQEA